MLVNVFPACARFQNLAWLFLHSEAAGRLSEEEGADILNVLRLVPSLTALRDLTQEFARLIRSRDVPALEHWLSLASASSFGPMKRLALGLASDGTAVRAALEQEWSNGQVEGQVNRLKFIKRSMYGRAGFDLLRARVLYRATA